MQNRLCQLLFQFPEKVGLSLGPFVLLVLRFYVASMFLRSGVQKLDNWDSTLYLFEYEYNVPLLSPLLAATLGTAAEILLPILLIGGLFTRLGAFALFVFNIVAVSSYPLLSKGAWGLTTALDIIPTGIVFPTKGFEDHVVWGMLLLVIFVYGAGKLSLDALIEKWVKKAG